MDGQRHRPGGRRRRKRSRPTPASEPILIAARRPNAPRLDPSRSRSVVASARPRSEPPIAAASAVVPIAAKAIEPAVRRTARIVALSEAHDDEQARLRSKLLDRLVTSDGPRAVTRAAVDLRDAGFEYPREQAVQLQLLDHADEGIVREALLLLNELLLRELPLKPLVLAQRLRRLEDHAEEAATRSAAAELRRLVRSRTSTAVVRD